MAANIDSNRWVVDCSFTAALFLPDESSKKVVTFFNKVLKNKNQLLVPGIWVYETGNVLVSALRRRRISLAQKQEILVLLGQLPIEIISLASLGEVSITAGISVELDISFYDASYLNLAVSNQCSLATLDQKLWQAAKTAGISTTSL